MKKTVDIWMTFDLEHNLVECDGIPYEDDKNRVVKTYYLNDFKDYKEVLERFIDEFEFNEYKIVTHYV